MKIIWGIVSILSTVVFFSLGSLFFSIQALYYLAASLNYPKSNPVYFYAHVFILGIIFYALGILSIYLLFKKSKVTYGYIVSVIANIIFLLIISLWIFSGIFDFFNLQIFFGRGGCSEVAQIEHVNPNIYDINSCSIGQGLKAHFNTKQEMQPSPKP